MECGGVSAGGTVPPGVCLRLPLVAMSYHGDSDGDPAAGRRGWWRMYRGLIVAVLVVVFVLCFLWCAGVAVFNLVEGE